MNALMCTTIGLLVIGGGLGFFVGGGWLIRRLLCRLGPDCPPTLMDGVWIFIALCGGLCIAYMVGCSAMRALL